MQVVLLAAGLGSRLGALTEVLPKALIEVAGEPLVAHALRFAARLEPTSIVVVGGYGFEALTRRLAELRAPGGSLQGLPIQLIENTNYRDGNLVSLLSARELVRDDFLLLNVDHIFRLSIAVIVQKPAAFVTAFVDTDRVLGGDDMKVERDPDGCVRRIAKTLTVHDCGYVGMTRVPHAALERYFAEADAALAAEGRAIHVERILARLADAGTPPLCRDISGHGWLEVDTPPERTAAEEALRVGEGWR